MSSLHFLCEVCIDSLLGNLTPLPFSSCDKTNCFSSVGSINTLDCLAIIDVHLGSLAGSMVRDYFVGSLDARSYFFQKLFKSIPVWTSKLFVNGG